MITKVNNFTVRTWSYSIAGQPGHCYEIRDTERQVRGSGWSRGKRRDALDDARSTIAKLLSKAAA